MRLLAVIAFSASVCLAEPSFTITPDPAAKLFHVALRIDSPPAETLDLKLPEWMPGYYRIMNYDRNLDRFEAKDGNGQPLGWEKVARNTWRIVRGGAKLVEVTYDIHGSRTFAAENSISDTRAFIAPPGFFLHIAGELQQPVRVAFHVPSGWTRVATSLDPAGLNTFTSPDFDVLYDSPMLLGNQETLNFNVAGVPHIVALENVAASVDRSKMTADLAKLVVTATKLIGEIPYKRYVFLMMGQGNGGIEHLNSMAAQFNGNSLTSENGYRGWLSYISHEYFHNFNVKRIRPIALGPFDYDTGSITDLLWISEGFTSYYEDIVMVRAGLMTREQYLAKITSTIAGYENTPGHRYQSMNDASLNAWGNSGVGGERNLTVSYYAKGPIIGLLLDLKIRAATNNKQSLDDVMRGLYRAYYQQKHRGFTDAEFWRECEKAAGDPVHDIKAYTATTKDVDYAKYFAYAGLSIDTKPSDGKGAYLGVNVDTTDAALKIADVSAGSPAEKAGLHAGDRIESIDGAAASLKALGDALNTRKPGDKLKLKVSGRDLEIELGVNPTRTFVIVPAQQPTAAQTAIYSDWLRPVQ